MKSSVPFELYKPQLFYTMKAGEEQSSVPFELYKPQPEVVRVEAVR